MNAKSINEQSYPKTDIQEIERQDILNSIVRLLEGKSHTYAKNILYDAMEKISNESIIQSKPSFRKYDGLAKAVRDSGLFPVGNYDLGVNSTFKKAFGLY